MKLNILFINYPIINYKKKRIYSTSSIKLIDLEKKNTLILIE